jgi:hypothetical protein
MKIEINDFGPISKFSFDLDKDLHLIYGENSIGKSYATYCVYNILKNFISFDDKDLIRIYSFYPNNENEKQLFENLNKDILNKLKESSTKVSIKEEALEITKYFLNDMILSNIQNSFLNTFSSLNNLKNRFSDKEPNIKKESDKFLFNIGIENERLVIKEFKANYQIYGNLQLNKDSLNLEIGNEKFDIRWGWGENSETNVGQIITEVLLRNILFNINKKIKNIYYLPASRSGLYQALNSFSPIIAELSQHRFYLKKEIKLPTLSEPISDYFINLSIAEKGNIFKNFDYFATRIEKEILKGIVVEEDKKLYFIPENTKLLLELSQASSMVSEISPIVAHLRYVIKNKTNLFDPRIRYLLTEEESKTYENRPNFIFIEEPEAHLHPKIQVKLMEIFSEMASSNIKIIMTSHSNYMFNKLGNLVLSKKINTDKVTISHLVMTKKGSKVIDDMQVTEEGIEDHNFSMVSEALYEERMKIFEEQNNA